MPESQTLCQCGALIRINALGGEIDVKIGTCGPIPSENDTRYVVDAIQVRANNWTPRSPPSQRDPG